MQATVSGPEDDGEGPRWRDGCGGRKSAESCRGGWRLGLTLLCGLAFGGCNVYYGLFQGTPLPPEIVNAVEPDERVLGISHWDMSDPLKPSTEIRCELGRPFITTGAKLLTTARPLANVRLVGVLLISQSGWVIYTNDQRLSPSGPPVRKQRLDRALAETLAEDVLAERPLAALGHLQRRSRSEETYLNPCFDQPDGPARLNAEAEERRMVAEFLHQMELASAENDGERR